MQSSSNTRNRGTQDSLIDPSTKNNTQSVDNWQESFFGFLNISFATNELARSHQQPTEHDNKRLNRLIRSQRRSNTKRSLTPTVINEG